MSWSLVINIFRDLCLRIGQFKKLESVYLVLSFCLSVFFLILCVCFGKFRTVFVCVLDRIGVSVLIFGCVSGFV